jgi:hypothetical protein
VLFLFQLRSEAKKGMRSRLNKVFNAKQQSEAFNREVVEPSQWLKKIKSLQGFLVAYEVILLLIYNPLHNNASVHFLYAL